MPSISVLMPVYNGQEFLRDAIESILHQTFADFEFIIVDDGSSDDSTKIVREYAAKDKRIQLVQQPKNMGVIEALTTGNRHCTGEYIARMDADDISLPDRLEKQYAYMQLHPEIDALGCNVVWIDEEGNMLDQHLVEPSDPVQVWLEMFFRCAIHHPTVFTRAEFYKRFNENGLENNHPHAEDYAFWLRMGFEHKYDNLEDVLLKSRRHGGRVSTKHTEIQRASQLLAATRAYQKILGREIAPETLKSFMYPKYYRFDDAKLNREAIRTMLLLEKTFFRKYPMTGTQKKNVKHFVFERVAAYTSRYQSDKSVMLEGVGSLFILSPFEFCQWIASFLKKNLGHPKSKVIN